MLTQLYSDRELVAHNHHDFCAKFDKFYLNFCRKRGIEPIPLPVHETALAISPQFGLVQKKTFADLSGESAPQPPIPFTCMLNRCRKVKTYPHRLAA